MKKQLVLFLFFGGLLQPVLAQQVSAVDTLEYYNPKTVKNRYKGQTSAFIEWDDKLWMGNDGAGVFYTADTGRTFIEVNTGIEEFIHTENLTGEPVETRSLLVTCLAVHADKLFCGTKFNGLFIYEKTKNRWYKLKKGIKDSTFWSIKSNGNYLFAASQDNGLFRSKDGITWESLPIELNNNMRQDSVVVSGFTTVYCNGKTVFVATPGKLVVSTDDGDSWTFLLTPFGSSLGPRFYISGEGAAVALVYFPGGVYVSKNNGIGWEMPKYCPVIPWSAEILNGRLWVCAPPRGSYRNYGLFVQNDSNAMAKATTLSHVGYITYYKGYYFAGGVDNKLYRFQYK